MLPPPTPAGSRSRRCSWSPSSRRASPAAGSGPLASRSLRRPFGRSPTRRAGRRGGAAGRRGRIARRCRTEEAAAIIANALAAGEEWLEPDEVTALLDCYHLPLVTTRTVKTAEEAVGAAAAFGRPIALKAVASGCCTRPTPAPSRSTWRAPRRSDQPRSGSPRPSSRAGTIDGFIVQPMAEQGVELLAGIVHDASFGPVLVCGAGGTSAELLGDVAVRITPLTDLDASEMLRSLHTFPLLDGYRGLPKCDIAAVERVLVSLSVLVETHPEIAELDANPLIAGPDGAVIVDCENPNHQPSVAEPRRWVPCGNDARPHTHRSVVFRMTDPPFCRDVRRHRQISDGIRNMAAHLKLAAGRHANPIHGRCRATPDIPISVVLADDRTAVRRMLRLLLDGEHGVRGGRRSGGHRRRQAPDERSRSERARARSAGPQRFKHRDDPRIARAVARDRDRRAHAEASPVFARKALDAGALGFVLQEHADGDLPEAVRRAAVRAGVREPAGRGWTSCTSAGVRGGRPQPEGDRGAAPDRARLHGSGDR